MFNISGILLVYKVL
ncbi:hypothetical protein KZO77_08750 [Prevotella melaninogenica]|uniref:Uncharacterized protein n=1 Tax=Prevotella melaninogenica TaxID=28132 RepID=A0ABS6Y912_9BACT|nr:hypothetical protein [Prevotella melaninogenica]